MVPELNTTSTADISFMLLTFFLVTTSMDVDRGLVRNLPPLDNDREQTDEATEVSRDNTLEFKLTASGQLLMNGTPASTKNLRRHIANFISRRPAQHVISVDPDPAADYNAYFQLEDEIMAAYNSVRDGIARRMFRRSYAALGETERNRVRDLCPQRISETYSTAPPADGGNGSTGKEEGGAR